MATTTKSTAHNTKFSPAAQQANERAVQAQQRGHGVASVGSPGHHPQANVKPEPVPGGGEDASSTDHVDLVMDESNDNDCKNRAANNKSFDDLKDMYETWAGRGGKAVVDEADPATASRHSRREKTKLASAMEPRAPRSLPPFRQWRGVEEVDPVNPWRGYTQN